MFSCYVRVKLIGDEQCHYSLQNGDDSLTWLDAQLTPTGENQAQTARAAWETQLTLHIPTPQSFYVSPLRRCLQTADITFRGIKGIPLTVPFRPVIKEVCSPPPLFPFHPRGSSPSRLPEYTW